jgi:molybdopterin synthase catalytic subunit
MGYARIQTEPFRLDDVLRELRQDRVGGVTFYVGTVRGDDDGRTVGALTYEAYPEMAQSTLEELRAETVERFGLVDAIVIHRTGRLPAGEPILLVALAGAHRGETFDAVRHLMDRLKAVVPIWKREEGSGGPQWILGPERRRSAP